MSNSRSVPFRSAEPFGSGWQIEPAAFARWLEAGGVFGPPTSAGSQQPQPRAQRRGGAESVSATLGWLYLNQGHLAEAAAIFAQVLDQLPGDARALQGQREVARRRLIERKIVRLRRFLAQMRDAKR